MSTLAGFRAELETLINKHSMENGGMPQSEEP